MKRRQESSTGMYHVIVKGINKERIFNQRREKSYFIKIILKHLKSIRWKSIVIVLCLIMLILLSDQKFRFYQDLSLKKAKELCTKVQEKVINM